MNITNNINIIVTPFSSALSALKQLIINEAHQDKKTDAIIKLILSVIYSDGVLTTEERDEFKEFIKTNFGNHDYKIYSKLLEEKTEFNIKECTDILSSSSDEEKKELIKILIKFSISDNILADSEWKLLKEISDNLNVPTIVFNELISNAEDEIVKRNRVLKSGSGILLTFSIIVIFALMTTFLRSVFLGLIFAYATLPLQNFIWGKIDSSDFLKGLFTRKVEEDKKEDKLITISSHLTVITSILLAALFSISLAWVSTFELSKLNSKKVLSKSELIQKVNQYKPNLEKLPYIKDIKDIFNQMINSKENKNKLKGFLLDRAKNFAGFVSDILAIASSFLLDLLLGIFFFSYFLEKMSLFKKNNKDKHLDTGEYLVSTIINTPWFPNISHSTKKETVSIINNIINIIQTWIKGYGAIILIESIIYITIFSILGLPYAFFVGLIAGFTVLLPFIGPLASGLITIITYASVTGDATQLSIILIIMGVYAFMNAIIEQLLLYPKFVGEALGLTTLETIIVVLLGGVFAGLVGMIFAVPVASVLKIVVPKIYNIWT
jgi:predicted PurR-regulated permease PerM